MKKYLENKQKAIIRLKESNKFFSLQCLPAMLVCLSTLYIHTHMYTDVIPASHVQIFKIRIIGDNTLCLYEHPLCNCANHRANEVRCFAGRATTELREIRNYSNIT